MAAGEADPSGSIWTRPITVPRLWARIIKILGGGLIVIVALSVLIGLAVTLYQRWTLGPGAQLQLTDAISIRVPQHFSATEYDPTVDISRRGKCYVIISDREGGGFVSVEALPSGPPEGFDDPARAAAYMRKIGKPVSGPVTFRHSGFDVTATVEPTRLRSRRAGAYTVNALVNVQGQYVYIFGDNISLGVPENAGPRTMAEAAIGLLSLAGD